jgi:hypothetical protein
MTDMEAGSVWKSFLGKHWSAFVIFAVAGVLVVVGALYVFWWFVGDAQSSGLVPDLVGLWTMNNLIMFILNLVFYELIIIGIPVVVGAMLGWQWWKRLPVEERMGYHWSRRTRTTRGSEGGSLLLFIGFCIKVYLDGNWNVPIANFSLNYVVDSVILVLIWVAVIIGIPGAIFGIWWVRREMKKP